MMKLVTVLLTTALICCMASASPLAPADAKVLEERATKIGAAFDAGDVGTIAEMTHPSLFALMGGKEKMVAILKTAMSEFEAMGVQVLESELGDPPEVYTAGSELVCFYPRRTVMLIGEKKVKSIGFLICIRKAQGGEWLFLDGSGLRKNPKLLKTLLPALPADVQLPENRAELIQ